MGDPSKKLRAVVALLRALSAHGTLDPEQGEDAAKAVRALRRALRAKDVKRVAKAAEDLARVFLERCDPDQ